MRTAVMHAARVAYPGADSLTQSETLLDHWMMKSASIGMISKIQPLIDHQEFLQSNSTEIGFSRVR
jgi:hypothetical protein